MIELNRDPSRQQLRWFAGLVFPAFWGWVAWLLYAKAGFESAAMALFSVALAVSLVGLASPAFMRRVWVGMMLALFPIGWVVSHLILGLVYYLVVTPVAIGLRLAGRDPLQRRLEPERESYWIDRDEAPEVERYFRQY